MTRGAKIKLTAIAAILALIALIVSLPIYGRVTPTARYTIALSHAKQLRTILIGPSESDLDRLPNSRAFVIDDPAYFPLLTFTDPFPPHHVIHFMDVRDATGGTILFASSNSIRDPNTGEWVRPVVYATARAPIILEAEFQKILKQQLTRK